MREGAIMLDEVITTFSINLQDYGTDIQHYEINTKKSKVSYNSKPRRILSLAL